MLFTRKQPDAGQKALAFKVSNSIAEALRDHLTWPRYGKYKYYYYLRKRSFSNGCFIEFFF